MTAVLESTRSLSTVLADYLDVVSERQAVGDVKLLGVTTGYDAVDDWTGGLERDNLYVLAAYASVGKSACGLQMALAAARSGVGVLYYSLEMSAQSLVNRLLGGMTGISSGLIMRGMLSGKQLSQVKEAAKKLAQINLHIEDRTYASTELLDHAQYFREANPDLGLVVVDYLNILRDPLKTSEVERVSQISGNLKALSRPDHLDLPVLTLAQLNRASQNRESRRPKMTDLKGSSSIEQDASGVFLLYRPFIEQFEQGAKPKPIENDCEFIITKNRNGSPANLNATFKPSTMTWTVGGS